jgi:hypothetical protein
MHKNHLVGCAAGIIIALAVVTLSGGSAGGLGILAAALVCPLVMTAAMFFLMGGNRRPPVNLEDPRQEATNTTPRWRLIRAVAVAMSAARRGRLARP